MPLKIFTQLTPLRVVSATSESPERWPSGAKENIVRWRQPSLRWRPSGRASASLTMQTVSGTTLPQIAYFGVYDAINYTTVTVDLSANQSTWTNVASNVTVPQDPRDSRRKLFYGWLLGSDPGSYVRITVPASTATMPTETGAFFVLPVTHMLDIRVGAIQHTRRRGAEIYQTAGGIDWQRQMAPVSVAFRVQSILVISQAASVMERLVSVPLGAPIVIALDRGDGSDSTWRAELYLGYIASPVRFVERATTVGVEFDFEGFA